jgi:hypothetical protein
MNPSLMKLMMESTLMPQRNAKTCFRMVSTLLTVFGFVFIYVIDDGVEGVGYYFISSTI